MKNRLYNMRFTNLFATTAVAIAIMLGTLSARAITVNHFATTSALAQGKWVKVAVDNDGMYQITFEQLAQMGFTDPSRVEMYGKGGRPIYEELNGSDIDDLKPIPTMLADGKLIFYGEGPVGTSLSTYSSTRPYYQRTFNAYSNHGYYFISESASPTRIQPKSPLSQGTDTIDTSYDCFLYEKELTSEGETGKQLLGESLLSGPLQFPYTLPGIANDTISVNVTAAAYIKSYASYVQSRVKHGNGSWVNVPFQLTNSKIYGVSASDPRTHYRYASPVVEAFTVDHNSDNGSIEVSVYSPSGSPTMKRLDNFIISYVRNNSYDRLNTCQFRMGYKSLANSALIALPNVDENTVVWDVTTPTQPMAMVTDNFSKSTMHINYTQIDDTTLVADTTWTVTNGRQFTPGAHSSGAYFMAFNPAEQLPTVSSFETVENQNIHGEATPDLIILTHKNLLPEAERLGQFHRDHDGIQVLVVDQEKVFNEFSSGAPDAMAVRLMCKMFYLRNMTKLKNLLVFGPATYDFRGLSTDKANRVITYETAASESDEYSYGTDDFFGLLEDNTGLYPTNDRLTIGVGRITAADLDEAKKDVDKVIDYIANPDYGPWRNNFTLWADTGNDYLHEVQAEGIKETVVITRQLAMMPDKAYVDFFPRAVNENSIEESRRTASEAKRHIRQMLNTGQYFGTYVGHANQSQFTFTSKMWTSTDVFSNKYANLPIMTTACCNVARYDSDNRGIAELMFHQPQGGAIALLTSSRQVEATLNDNLNRAFTEALFNYNDADEMGTLGEVYKFAKQSQLVLYDINKMSFFLLGDPATRIAYPRPLVKVTNVAGVDINTAQAQVVPLQRIAVEAQVIKKDKTLDTSFNGDATVTLYDAERLYKYINATIGGKHYDRNITYPRDVLAQVNARAEGGIIRTELVVPRTFKAADGEKLVVCVYAHQDNTDHLVSGLTDKVVAAAPDSSLAIHDDTAPVINHMFINDEASFDNGALINDGGTLYIRATDDVSFNTQSMPIGNTMKLTIDNSNSNNTLVSNFTTCSDGGRTLSVAFPMPSLAPGRHTATFWVQDAAGNCAERTVSFTIGSSSDINIAAERRVVFDDATITTDDTEAPEALEVRITDANGNITKTAKQTALPYTWDLTGNDGKRVKPGLYRAFVIYDNGTNRGSSNAADIVVVNRARSNR